MSSIAENAKAIFLEAVENHAPDQWPRFLDQACAGDEKLRQRVEGLLQAHAEKDSLFDPPAPTEDMSSSTDLAGETIGPYKLLQQLGEGGMGIVYLAERQQPVKQRVALKIVKHGMDSKKFIARFEAERQALAMMDHPNIAKVLDAGCTENGRPYFVMELVKGIPISEFCDENRLTTRQRLELFVQVCQAVHHAHQKGIIHRDIKPSNVLVALYDDKPVPKVIDFGVAKATNQQLTEKTLFTEVGSILGTWEYMSPEQAVLNQLDVDTRTDVYSLGVLLYELLTGETPLDRKRLREAQLHETLRMIREEEPPKPSTRVSSQGERATATAAYRKSKPESLASEIRGDLDWIVMKALAKERERRYDSPSRLADDIERFLTDDIVEARPPSTWYRVQRFYRRNRLLTTSVAAIMIALAAGFIVASVGVWFAWDANTALREEQQELKETKERAVKNYVAEQKARQEVSEAREDVERRRILAEEDLYFADMRIAADAYQLNNFRKLRELLQKHESREAVPDFRGVEWSFLSNEASRFQDIISMPQGQYITELAMCEGSHLLASVDRFGSVRFSEPANLAQRRFTDTSFETAFFQSYVSLVMRDGRLLVAHPDEDLTKVRITDVNRPTNTIGLEHESRVWDAKFSPDGRFLAAATTNDCRIWDLETRDHEILLRTGDHGRFSTVKFSPDGNVLAISGETNGVVHVHDRSTGMSKTLFGHPAKVGNLDFSPDGSLLATGGGDGGINVWNLDQGDRIALVGHPEAVRALAFSPDGSKLVSSGREKLLKIWDIASGAEVQSIPGQPGITNSIVFSPDGETIYTAGVSGRVYQWPMSLLNSQKDSFDLGQPKNLWYDSVGMSFDGNQLFVLRDGEFSQGKLEAWDLRSCQRIDLPFECPEDLQRIAVSSRNHLLTLRNGSELTLRDFRSGATVTQFEIPAGERVTCFAFSSDGSLLAVGLETGGVSLFATEGSTPIEQYQLHFDEISCLAISPDNSKIVAIESRGALKMIEIANGEPIAELDLGRAPFIYHYVMFSPDPTESLLAIVWNGVRLWDWNKEDPPRKLPRQSSAYSNAMFSADGRTLMTPTADGSLGIFDVATLRERIVIRRHRHSIDHSAAQNVGGVTTLATIGRDGVVRNWRFSMPEEKAAMSQ